MDSITHTLMGLTIYGTAKKKEINQEVKKAIFVSSAAGNLHSCRNTICTRPDHS